MQNVIILNIFLCSLAAIGWGVVISPGNIFEQVGQWIANRKNEKVRKVLGLCPPCVAGQICLWYTLIQTGHIGYSILGCLASVAFAKGLLLLLPDLQS